MEKKEILVGTKQEIIDYLSKEHDNNNSLGYGSISATLPETQSLNINYQLEKVMKRSGGIGAISYVCFETVNESAIREKNEIPEINIHLKYAYVHVKFKANIVCELEKKETKL